MRFTKKNGKIVLRKAGREIMRAYQAGVNYFDTAYIYGDSEEALGKIFTHYGIREKICIATKLPQYLVKKKEDAERIFTEELRRLQTGYVDYYLMHMLNDPSSWQRLVDLGILDWLLEKQAAGQIRQIGFSYHGNADQFCKLLDAYDWDFCQIQYNYLDEHAQAGRTGLEYAAKKGVPVIIMEPLRGGKLTDALPEKAKEVFRKADSGRSPAEWGFRWLYDQPGVTVVLSGMNTEEMVLENARIAGTAEVGCVSDAERAVYGEVLDIIRKTMKVGCTGCRYCMPCPHHVDIPGVFAAWNRKGADGYISALREYFMCVAARHDYTGAANCVGCGACEAHCPQGIGIRKELAQAKKELEGVPFRTVRAVAPLVMRY